MACGDGGGGQSVLGPCRGAGGEGSLVERSRAQVAAAVGCKPDEVIFTSGATEAAMVLSQLCPMAMTVLVDPDRA